MHTHESQAPGFQPQVGTSKPNSLGSRPFEVTFPGQELAAASANPFVQRSANSWATPPAAPPPVSPPPTDGETGGTDIELDWQPQFGLYAAGQPTPPPPRSWNLQAKLTIGQPNDPYEQEADRVAEQVMATPAPPSQIQRQTETQATEAIQPQSLVQTITPIVQRQETSEGKEPIQSKREACETEEQVQRSANNVVQTQPDFEGRLNASKGGGGPLPEEVRSFMEPRFGADFRQVRVHTGSEAVQMNQELGAQAFTHQNHIYYGAGKAPAKDELTGHELTHVVQQIGNTSHLQRQCRSSPIPEPERVVDVPYNPDFETFYQSVARLIGLNTIFRSDEGQRVETLTRQQLSEIHAQAHGGAGQQVQVGFVLLRCPDTRRVESIQLHGVGLPPSPVPSPPSPVPSPPSPVPSPPPVLTNHSDTIRQAIELIRHSRLAATPLGRSIVSELSRQYGQGDIAFTQLHDEWGRSHEGIGGDHNTSGPLWNREAWMTGEINYDIEVDSDLLGHSQTVAATAVVLVHEAVHLSQESWSSLYEEIQCFQQEAYFYQELLAGIELNGILYQIDPAAARRVLEEGGERSTLGRAQDQFVYDEETVLIELRNQHLVDWVINQSTYYPFLNIDFVRNHHGDWGGLPHRLPRTRVFYLDRIFGARDPQDIDLALDLLETFSSLSEIETFGLPRSRISQYFRDSMQPTETQYLQRIQALETSWGVQLRSRE